MNILGGARRAHASRTGRATGMSFPRWPPFFLLCGQTGMFDIIKLITRAFFIFSSKFERKHSYVYYLRRCFYTSYFKSSGRNLSRTCNGTEIPPLSRPPLPLFPPSPPPHLQRHLPPVPPLSLRDKRLHTFHETGPGRLEYTGYAITRRWGGG